MASITGQDMYGFYETAESSTTIDKSPVRLPDSPGKDELEWYEHSPIDASNQIRLIELLPPQGKNGERNSNEALRCKIHSPLFVHAPTYEALSYTWGNMNRHLVISVVLDECEEQALFVTPQLLMALRRLRLPFASRYLWIDQLCIDQENNAEKGPQIQLMGNIYRKAERVVIWLGEDCSHFIWEPAAEEVGYADVLADLCKAITQGPDQTPAVELELMKDLVDIRPRLSVHANNIESTRLLAIYEVLNRPWFRRAWVFQEASLACRSLVQYGSWEVRFEDFKRLIDAVSHLEAESGMPPRRRLAKETSGFEMVQLIQNARARQRVFETHDADVVSQGGGTFLSTLLQILRRVEAFDPRDLIFAFLAFQVDEGIASTAESYEQTQEEVWKYATECIIKSSKSLDVFAALSGDVERKLQLPSWVPSWSECFPYSRPIAAPGSRFRSSRRMPHIWKDHEKPMGLAVQGKIIGTIATFLPSPFARFRRRHQPVKLFLNWLVLLDTSKRHLYNFKTLLGDSLQVKLQTLEADLMRTVLADGAMGSEQPLRCVSEMMKIITSGEHAQQVRDEERSDELTPAAKVILTEYEKLEDLAVVAEMKQIFFTENLQLGMAASAIHVGDQIAIIHGSKTPCVLRQAGDGSGEYSVISQCYLDGWMYGNPPKDRPHPHGTWWKEKVDDFIII